MNKKRLSLIRAFAVACGNMCDCTKGWQLTKCTETNYKWCIMCIGIDPLAQHVKTHVIVYIYLTAIEETCFSFSWYRKKINKPLKDVLIAWQ